jgi:hypothetical protein
MGFRRVPNRHLSVVLGDPRKRLRLRDDLGSDDQIRLPHAVHQRRADTISSTGGLISSVRVNAKAQAKRALRALGPPGPQPLLITFRYFGVGGSCETMRTWSASRNFCSCFFR